MKKCRRCGRRKARSEFNRDRKNKDGLRSSCKSCESTKRKATWAADVQKSRAAQRARHKKLTPENKKNRELRYRYGISLAEYTAMFEAQGGRCGICLEKFPVLDVDHCHKTGRVRGLLCGNCNHGLGKFGDSPEKLARAIQYLRHN